MLFKNYLTISSKELPKNQVKWSEESRPSAGQIIKLYKSLNILCNLFNEMFALYLNPTMKILCVVGASLSVAGSIRLYGQLDFIYYLILPSFSTACYFHLIALCAGTAFVYENTVDFIYNSIELVLEQAKTVHAKEFSRQLRSCRSLRTYFGHSYFFKKSTAITTFGIVVNFTVYLLLA